MLRRGGALNTGFKGQSMRRHYSVKIFPLVRVCPLILDSKTAFINKLLIESNRAMTSLSVSSVATQPFEGQKPGTSGLRKPVQTFMKSNYSENFIQCILNAVNDKTKLVIGGDGRYHNKPVVQTIISMCAANNVSLLSLILAML